MTRPDNGISCVVQSGVQGLGVGADLDGELVRNKISAQGQKKTRSSHSHGMMRPDNGISCVFGTVKIQRQGRPFRQTV